jgi:NAD+ diphosphatase
MLDEFKASVSPTDSLTSQAWWFIFSGYRLLVSVSDNSASVPFTEATEKLGMMAVRRLHIGTLRGFPCYAAETDFTGEVPSGYAFEELRSLFGRLEDPFYQAALTAVHLVEWDKNSLFCGKCCGELKTCTDVRAKKCEQCGRLEFPRVSPAIIVLIEKGDTLLLARSARFPLPFFSVLAGFVEPGESLEAAVHREVMEETGIGVKNIKYFGSQPWPFPDSLMLGFTAEYDSGEIKIDGEEIVEAGWYRFDNLPQIPGKLSIARQLIDWFIAKNPKKS